MTPEEKIEQALSELSMLRDNISYSYEFKIDSIEELLEAALSDLSGESPETLPTTASNSIEEELAGCCVLIDKGQCDSLLKTLELYTKFSWRGLCTLTCYTPFNSSFIKEPFIYINFHEDRTLAWANTDEKDFRNPVEKSFQELMDLLKSYKENVK